MSGITLIRNVRVRPENNRISRKFEIPIIKKESRNANKPEYEQKRNRKIESTTPDKIR